MIKNETNSVKFHDVTVITSASNRSLTGTEPEIIKCAEPEPELYF